MTAGLWPALLAALLGRAGLHEAGGRSSEGQLLLGWTTAAVTGQNAVYCWIGLLCFVLLAYLTNPSDASFRAHLTDLSFRLHLKRLQAAEPDTNAAFSAPGSFQKAAPATNTQTAAGSGKVSTQNNQASVHTSTAKDKGRKDSANGQVGASATAKKQQQHLPQQQIKGKPASINGDNGRPHVLSFSNRVTISLKTPSYVRTSYALFSTVKILPAPLPTSQKIRAASQSSRKASLKGKKVITNSTTGSSASARGDSAGSKKRSGFVSSLAHNLASIASTNPWVEQGGYFIGVLGYWWTIDDGTSTSGAREKTRTANAILAVEEQVDDEVSVNEARLGETRSPQSLEDGQVTPTDSSSKQIVGGSTSANSDNTLNGTSSGPSNSSHRSKHIQRLANNTSNLALFRAGQRRSSPTPRLVATGPNTRNTAKRANSGELSPLPVSSPDTPSMNQGESSSSQRNQSDPLDLHADKNLPGLPFHVDASARNKALTSTNVGEDGRRAEADAAIKINGQSSVSLDEGGDDQLATVSHTAPAVDQESSTVSPACALLQNQLDELRASTESTQARLNAELEDLRARKSDEDNVRTELKSRMKTLEDVKRSAEQNRLEAEKKLITARAQRKTVEDRVTKVKNELSKVEKKEKEHHEKVAKTRQERTERLAKLREDVNARQDIVEKEVEATERLSTRVQQLEVEIEERKGELVHLRDEAAQAARLRMNVGRGPPPLPVMAPRHPSSHPGSNSSPNLNQYYENASSAGMPYSSVPHPHPHSHVNQSLSSEDNARPASPARTPPGFTSAQAISGPAGQVKGDSSHYSAPFGNSFLEHRLQHRRPHASNASMPISNTSGSTGSKQHTNTLGRVTSLPGASLYHRQPREGPNAYGGETESDDVSGILGTFAPFGPLGSPEVQVSDGTKAFGNGAPSESKLHGSPSLGEDSSPLGDTSSGPKKITPPATSALGKIGSPSGIGSRRLDAPQLERTNSGSSESSSVNGGAHMLNPLSPMTPHQASLIPSQLFDMLDDVEMPTSPSPTLTAAHQAFSHGINRRSSDDLGNKAQGDASPVSLANRPINIGSTASAWDTLDDFLFDAPMSTLSRKVSNSTQTRVDPKNFSSQSPVGQSSSTRDLAVSPPESVFSHGARSAASTGESLSPSLTSAASQTSFGKNSAFASASSSSPHEYSLFEKARHALSLNPDAKAFSFNRPLPASSSFGQLRPHNNHQDAKAAFEGHGASSMNVPPGLKHNHNAAPSTSSLELGGSSNTWASPIGAYRGIPGASSNTTIGSASVVGHGKPSSPNAAATTNGANHRTTSAGSSFSPFDDDDLLRGW